MNLSRFKNPPPALRWRKPMASEFLSESSVFPKRSIFFNVHVACFIDVTSKKRKISSERRHFGGNIKINIVQLDSSHWYFRFAKCLDIGNWIMFQSWPGSGRPFYIRNIQLPSFTQNLPMIHACRQIVFKAGKTCWAKIIQTSDVYQWHFRTRTPVWKITHRISISAEFSRSFLVAPNVFPFGWLLLKEFRWSAAKLRTSIWCWRRRAHTG